MSQLAKTNCIHLKADWRASKFTTKHSLAFDSVCKHIYFAFLFTFRYGKAPITLS